MFRAHLLIIRRSKLHYTASGIITPIGVMIPSWLYTEIHGQQNVKTVFNVTAPFFGIIAITILY